MRFSAGAETFGSASGEIGATAQGMSVIVWDNRESLESIVRHSDRFERLLSYCEVPGLARPNGRTHTLGLVPIPAMGRTTEVVIFLQSFSQSFFRRTT